MLLRDLAAVLKDAGMIKDELLLEDGKLPADERMEITGIEHDSRKVKPGFVFVAVEGFQTDGHKYIKQAVEGGATAVIMSKQVAVPESAAAFCVHDTRKALALLSAHFYGYPAEKLTLIGVTGTNGKTTTTHLIESICREGGMKTGLIGTIHNKIGEQEMAVRHTTPESLELQRLLRQMLDEGVQCAAMEVSSHALALERAYGCCFEAAVFTNLTQDHLDFHGNMHNYLEAKAKLFLQAKNAVINEDDPAAKVLAGKAAGNVYTYGLKTTAFFRADGLKVKPGGVSFRVCWQGRTAAVNLKLTGLFNVYNALAAFSVGIILGFEPGIIIKALESVRSVPGRFELVDKGQDFSVIVDYAHTPDGLENVLKTAREITGGRLVTVFGCGGDRDRTKRPLMGEIAARYSDFSILTSDNPRTEAPEKIIADVEKGMRKVRGAEYIVEPDRKKAIFRAVSKAQRGDVIIIAGKGHETYQIIGKERFPFDDRVVASLALDELVKKGEVPCAQDDIKGDSRDNRGRCPAGRQ